MRIVQLITGSSSFGGAEAHVRDLSIGLRGRGHDCTVMVGPPEGALAEQLREAGVPVVPIPALRKPIRPVADAVCFAQVMRALRKARPEIVAAHTAKAGFIGRFAARRLGAPVFFTPHGLSFVDRERGTTIGFRLLLERLAARTGGQMIAVCEAERRLALQYLGSQAAPVVTIPHGLPDCETRGERSGGRAAIAMVARFDRQKDHATLVRALSSLRHLEWELRLAGSGPLLESIQRMVEERGLASRVTFLRQHRDTPGLLAASDIFVLASHFEAFPISILEAMRAGLPVIATDTGGVCEAVEEDWNGFLIPVGDSSRLAERLTLLLQSPELRKSMGMRSRLRFRRDFEWRRMLDRTEALYASALRNGIRCEMAPGA